MEYDFDKIISRARTDSIKWDYISKEGRLSPRQAGDNFRAKDELLPMWVADMDFPSPQPVLEAMQKRVAHGVFGYTQPSAPYYEAIIGWMHRRKGWLIEKDWILTTPKVMLTIDLLIQTLTDPGDGIIVQTPLFHPIYLGVEFNGRTLLRNRLTYKNGRYSIDFDDLLSKAKDPRTKMLILCSPHNPVGRVWTRAELTSIGEICVQNGVLLIVDEIHSDLLYSWAKFTTFGALGTQFFEHLIVCNGPSKTFNLPGLQISNVIIPDKSLREKLHIALRNLDQLFGVNTFGALALQAAYEQGEPWLAQVMAYIEGNYLYLKEHLARTLPKIQIVRPEAMYLIWLDCRNLGMESEALYRLIFEEASVYLENGVKYGPEGEGFLRINIACPRAILEEALARIIGVLAS
ncbi:MAG: pyridoxal phosphate-dependent aminotransferase [Chloroflexi bacterium]|nr:pyridoxal phosphate-dependent aminotransferase [Chloroflexota bacterium]